MEKQRFYINTEGNDDISARAKAIEHAIKLAQTDLEIDQIILLIHSKSNDGWFRKIFDDNIVKKLFKGMKFSDCRVPMKIETVKTFRESHSNNPSEIVVVFGMDSEQLNEIDDFYSVKAIILVPWLKENVKKWVQTWNPEEISGNGESIETYPEPSEVVKKAMNSLTSSINMSTGISHPMDEELAKTYILALHKYESTLDADIVGSYLVKQLSWQTEDAADVEKLINTLNAGKFFKGGKRTGLKEYYNLWKAK
jgi:hypothetical protein